MKNLPISDNLSFAPARKCADPISAAISGVLGGVGNIISTGMTNRTNQRLARENMAWQSSEAEKSRAFAREQSAIEWERTDPAVQMQRMKNAGLNPFISENAVPVGDAPHTQTPSVPGSPPLPQQSAPSFDFLGNLVPLILQSKKIESETFKNKADAFGEISKTAAEIYQTYGKKAGDEFLKNNAPFINGADYGAGDTNKLIQATVKKSIAEADLSRTNADIEAKYGDQRAQRIIWQFDQEYAESVARIANINATNQREDKRLEVEVQEAAQRIVESCARAANLDAQSDQIYGLLPYLVASANAKSIIDSVEAGEAKSVYGSRSMLRRVRGKKWYQSMVAFNEGIGEMGGNVGKMISDALSKYLQMQTVGAAKAAAGARVADAARRTAQASK